MRAGEFPNGARVLRAKIDMTSGNLNMRDPVLYRILHAHHRGPARHGISIRATTSPTDSRMPSRASRIRSVRWSLPITGRSTTGSWIIFRCRHIRGSTNSPRLNVTHTLLSKRVLTQLVRDGHVSGWDDPRMPTLAGLRRRGIPAEALREFVKRIGVAKANSTVDIGMFDFAVRETLNKTAQRRMAVLKPLKVVIENYPEGQVEVARGGQSSRRSVAGRAPDSVRPRALHRAGRLHGKSAEEVLPPFAGSRSAAFATAISSPARRSSRTRPATLSSCAARTIRQPVAVMRPTGAR